MNQIIRDYQAIQKIWFIKGKQKKIPTYGKHAGVKLMGILDYETGYVYCEEHEKYDAEVFLQFLKNILSKYQTGKIVMVLDNARIYNTKLIQPFLDENKCILTIVFLPPYSPDLNLIEWLWGWLKSNATNNAFYSNMYQIHVTVDLFLDTINKTPQQRIDKLCIKL